jgi:hypothetical protein
MNSQHIGAAGELLVQYRLLKLGIDSARLTTDAGIDLVVYAPADRSAITVQVKANFGPKPAGGKGPLNRSWYFPHAYPAQLLALVALDVDAVWIFTIDGARELAQQHSEKGMRQLYWRRDRVDATPRRFEDEMDCYRLEHRAGRLFPTSGASERDACV